MGCHVGECQVQSTEGRRGAGGGLWLCHRVLYRGDNAACTAALRPRISECTADGALAC